MAKSAYRKLIDRSRQVANIILNLDVQVLIVVNYSKFRYLITYIVPLNDKAVHSNILGKGVVVVTVVNISKPNGFSNESGTIKVLSLISRVQRFEGICRSL